MQSLLPIVNIGASFFVVFSQAFVVIFLALFLAKKKYKIFDFISKYILQLGLLLSISAILVSLFYSDVIGYPPCFFCWMQRIFIYPLFPLFAMALWKRDRGIIDYALLMSVIGFVIGAYQNLIYYFNVSFFPCPASGPSCAAHYVSELGGYVSIPMMSATAFILIAVLLLIAKYRKND